MTSMPTALARSSRRKPPSLRSTGVWPFAAYQRCCGSQAVSSSSLVGSSVVWWISATPPTHSSGGPVAADLEPEEIPGTQCHQHLSVVPDLGQPLSAEQVDELRPCILHGQLDRRGLRPRGEVVDAHHRLVGGRVSADGPLTLVVPHEGQDGL